MNLSVRIVNASATTNVNTRSVKYSCDGIAMPRVGWIISRRKLKRSRGTEPSGMNEMVFVLTWIAFLSSLLLMVVKVWNLYDALLDWRAVQFFDTHDARYQIGAGGMRMGWLRLIDGFFWVFLGSLLFFTSSPETPRLYAIRGVTRVVIILMIWLELAKVLNDRVTRINVMGNSQNTETQNG